jgi:hypothetical protein
MDLAKDLEVDSHHYQNSYLHSCLISKTLDSTFEVSKYSEIPSLLSSQPIISCKGFAFGKTLIINLKLDITICISVYDLYFFFSSLMIKFGIAFNGASIFVRFHDRILLLYL